MPIALDCSGLPCPQPVIKCKNILETDAPQALSVIVDNDAARQNVSRFLASRGYAVTDRKDGERWVVEAARDAGACEIMTDAEVAAADQKVMVMLATDVIGHGDDDLGARLMFNFLATLPELGGNLWRIVMVNGGVRLACEGHPCLEKLAALERSGVSLLVCGTCLDHYGLLDKKRVGQTTNMLDIVTSIQLATKTIRV